MLEQGGIQPGGLNFDCKVRRESTELKDMFIAHIGIPWLLRTIGYPSYSFQCWEYLP